GAAGRAPRSRLSLSRGGGRATRGRRLLPGDLHLGAPRLSPPEGRLEPALMGADDRPPEGDRRAPRATPEGDSRRVRAGTACSGGAARRRAGAVGGGEDIAAEAARGDSPSFRER